MTLALLGPPGSPSCHHLTAGDPEVKVPSQGARGLPAARGQRAEAPARGVPRLSSSAPHTCLFFSNRQFCPLSHTPVLARAKGPRCGAQGPAADRPPWIGCGCETGTAPSASRGQARDAGRGTPRGSRGQPSGSAGAGGTSGCPAITLQPCCPRRPEAGIARLSFSQLMMQWHLDARLVQMAEAAVPGTSTPALARGLRPPWCPACGVTVPLPWSYTVIYSL